MINVISGAHFELDLRRWLKLGRKRPERPASRHRGLEGGPSGLGDRSLVLDLLTGEIHQTKAKRHLKMKTVVLTVRH